MDLLGIRLIGLDAETGRKVLITVVFFAAVLVLRWAVVAAVWLGTGRHGNAPAVFWTRQATSVLALIVCVLAVLSIWLGGPMSTAVGLVTAGIAVALRKVWTSLAGYLLILRGKAFGVGERITMGGVRGDVLSLGLLQTRILEMDPSTRQYTGRIVSVTNDKVFDQPVSNLSQEFPYLFEEIRVPIKYGSDRVRAERILLDAARPATEEIRRCGDERLREISLRYGVPPEEIVPHVYYRLTETGLEMTLRILVPDHAVRKLKDQIAREILNRFEATGLDVASARHEIAGIAPSSSRPAPAAH